LRGELLLKSFIFGNGKHDIIWNNKLKKYQRQKEEAQKRCLDLEEQLEWWLREVLVPGRDDFLVPGEIG
jgi:hypothetical protein